jgi:hypothetical protein
MGEATTMLAAHAIEFGGIGFNHWPSQDKHAVSHFDFVAYLEAHLFDSEAVDMCAIRAVEISHLKSIIHPSEVSVMAGYSCIIDLDLAGFIPAE